MLRRITRLLAVTSVLFASTTAQAGPLTDFLFRRPNGSAVITTTYARGRVKQQLTYPGYSAGFMEPPAWIQFGYPGTNAPVSRNSSEFGFNPL